ncbi:MAG: molybdopterin molybdotransferase MoeA [Prochloron sp. SP5CPC1]|nr:molybdopterin molybdotransferase MoeA [Candidatus Paraprochloron terpiosi SP5CPC1]
MLSVTQAESTILDLVQPLEDTETVNLLSAINPILAQPVTSNLDFPYWDNAAMDGYAVRYDDVRHAPATLTIVEEIPAGYQPQVRIKPRTAARIFTGAMVPEGADTIVMQEHTTRIGNEVTILTSPKPGEFLRQKGSFYQANAPLLTPGIALNEADIAVLATVGCHQFTVYRRPRVAIFSTGNELVSPGTQLQPGQIIDSNQYALAAFVQKNGAIPICMGIVPDDPVLLKATIEKTITTSDLLLSTGGVYVRNYDYM